MPGKSPIGNAHSSYRKSVVMSQAVEVHLSVQSITTTPIRIDDALTIPANTPVLMRPLDDDTAEMISPILNYEVITYKKLADGDNPEAKRDIEPELSHVVNLANPLYHTYVRRMPRTIKIGHCTKEDVEDYLRNHPLPENGCAFILSNSTTKLFYVDQNGIVQELAGLTDTGVVPSFKNRIRALLINVDTPLSYNEAVDAYNLFEHKDLFPFKVKEQYQMVASHAPIFPTDDSPCIEEIQQRSIPDCFLLAALQSILNHEDGKAFVREMIVDHHNGWVSVRLFDPETRAPVMVKIRKAILTENGKALNGHTGLWVYLIEAAYASLGQKRDEQVGPSQAAVFSGGGLAYFALQILTGKESEYIFTKLPSKDVPVFMNKEKLESVLKIYSDAIALELSPEEASKCMNRQFQFQFDNIVLSGSILKWVDDDHRPDEMSDETLEALHQYIHYYKENKEEYDAILDNDRLSVEEKIDALHDLLRSKNAPESLCALFTVTKQALTAEQLAQRPLIAFSGQYSPEARALYEKIKDNLGKKNQLTTGTRSKKSYEQAKLEILPGIASTHAYSIHKAYEKTEIINGVPKQVLYIQVRNPWGTMGMSYRQNEAGEMVPEKESNCPLFEIELNDFIKMMQGISIMENGNLFSFSQEIEKLAKNIREGDLFFSAKLEMSQLLKNKKILDDFFKMELKHLEYLSPEVKEKIQIILETKEYSRDQKREQILAVLQENNPQIPFFHGHQEYQNSHLVNLFIFLEESKKPNPNTDSILSLKHQIFTLSGYSFSKRLIAAQLSFEDMIRETNHKFYRDIEDLESALEKLEELTGRMNGSGEFYPEATNQLVVHNMGALKVLRKNMKEAEIFLANMGCPLNEEKKARLQAIDEKMEIYSLGSIDDKIDLFRKTSIAIELHIGKLSSDLPEDVLTASLRSIEKVIAEQQKILDEIQEVEDPRILGMKRQLKTLSEMLEEKKITLSPHAPAPAFNGRNSHSSASFWARLPAPPQEGLRSFFRSSKKEPGLR